MTASTGFDLADHDLTVTIDDVAPDSHRIVGICACSNPDGYGLGRVDWAGATVTAVVAEYAEHVLALAVDHVLERAAWIAEHPTWQPVGRLNDAEHAVAVRIAAAIRAEGVSS